MFYCCRVENNEQAPLQVEVAAPGSPESPQPSPGSPSPVFEVPEGDASTFMGFYSLVDLEEWARRSRELRGTQDYVMVEPMISDNLRLSKIYTGPAVAIQTDTPVGRGTPIPIKSIP